MNEEEFKNLIIGLNIVLYRLEKNRYSIVHTRYLSKYGLRDLFLYEEWCTGGIGGGSCYDYGEKTHHYYTSGEKEPDNNSLDLILSNICPHITFLQHKTLTANVIKTDEYSVDEYYGNSSNYSYKVINLKTLFEKLRENNFYSRTTM